MDLVLPHIYKLKDIDNIYIEVRDNEYKAPSNAFDYIFNQKCDDSYKVIDCGFVGRPWTDFAKFEDLELIKSVCRLLKFKDEILNKVIQRDNCLGIHFRGKDMNTFHPEYGIFTYNDYFNKLKTVDKFDSVFIASDNIDDETRFFEDIKIPTYSYHNPLRSTKGKNDVNSLNKLNMSDINFWQEVFVDMLTLSSCEGLIYRTSNLAFASIAFSNTLTKLYKL